MQSAKCFGPANKETQMKHFTIFFLLLALCLLLAACAAQDGEAHDGTEPLVLDGEGVRPD